MGLSRCGGVVADAITGGLCDLTSRSRSGVMEPQIAADGLVPIAAIGRPKRLSILRDARCRDEPDVRRL